MAVLLADRVVNENLTVAAIRTLVPDAMRPAPAAETDREEIHNRRANTTIVQDVTSDLLEAPYAAPIAEESHERLGAVNQSSELSVDASSADDAKRVTADLTLLQEAAAALSSIAARTEALPNSAVTQYAIHQIEQALAVLRRAFGSHTY